MIRTYSGLYVNPLAIKTEDVKIRDIAHHLACFNRFCGALHQPINIASHSILVMRLVRWHTDDTQTLLQALLHDATEAYLGDVTKWLKQSPQMQGYRDAEDAANNVIMDRFCLPRNLYPEVKDADRVAVTYEAQVGFKDENWHTGMPAKYAALTDAEKAAINGHNPFMGWWEAKHMFLEEFTALWAKYGEEEDVEGD